MAELKATSFLENKVSQKNKNKGIRAIMLPGSYPHRTKVFASMTGGDCPRCSFLLHRKRIQKNVQADSPFISLWACSFLFNKFLFYAIENCGADGRRYSCGCLRCHKPFLWLTWFFCAWYIWLTWFFCMWFIWLTWLFCMWFIWLTWFFCEWFIWLTW